MKSVSVRSCKTYNYEEVKLSIEKNLEDIGGIDKFVKKGSKVLIKPNLLMKKKPEEATTTHPMVVKVVCEKLLELNCDITIADSPGGPYNQSSLKSIYKASGIEEVANELGIKLNYDVSDVKIHSEKAHVLKYMDIIKPIVDSDYIINLCKLKTHIMATFTGGTKNLYGCIAGLKKAEIHYRFPTEELFCENVLLDICDYIKPTLTIMDGIVGMESDGPSAGTTREIGVLLASQNPYAIDVVACKIISLLPNRVATIRGAIKRGYIQEDFSDIEILGEDIKDLIIKNYKIPNVSKDLRLFSVKLPKFLNEPISKLITPKPVVRFQDCIKCGKCKEACPASTIEIGTKGAIIDLSKCIRCYCCHELCPKKAIDVKRNFVFKYVK
ncbi:DUF362 domain-containing protein [Clostridioides difficile]|uniref:DUF362 domain-containing protein n=1 Tax=Clostridioides difficile TaxID=1496 RepID=UPI000BB1E3D2|nr:DUF362 domain-containing protein [Clostridioides difficile]PBE61200.1 iron-sulfur protein [Clostridioides difficile]